MLNQVTEQQENPSRMMDVTANPPLASLYTDIVSYARIVIMNIWLIGLITILGTLASYTVIQAQPVIYQTYTSTVVSPQTSSDLGTTLQSLDVLRLNVIGTYVQILSSRSVVEDAIKHLTGDFSPTDIEEAELEVIPVDDSSVIRVVVRSQNPALAQELANSIVYQAISRNPVDALAHAYPLGVLDEAEMPTEPVAPDVRFGLLMGAAGSLLAGIGMAFLFHNIRLSRRKG